MQELSKQVPSDFELLSQKKGVKRFMTPRLRGLLQERATALQTIEEALSGILQVCALALYLQKCSILQAFRL